MANRSRYSATGGDTDVEPDRDGGMPRWVKVLAGIGIILIVLFVLMVNGVFGTGHGPGRHSPAGGAGAAPPVGTDHQPPSGGHDPSMSNHG
jgi:hypothetical protein